MTDFVWDPGTYRELMAEEIADYDGLQARLAEAVTGMSPSRILDLGTGTGETARQALAAYPDAELVGLDASDDMLDVARTTLAGHRVSLLRQRLQEPLPGGAFDLAVSALAVHHLDGAAKADLFRRVHRALTPGGRFVLADLVVPERAQEAFTEIDWVEDLPSTVDAHLDWLSQAGFETSVVWRHRDLAVFVSAPADR